MATVSAACLLCCHAVYLLLVCARLYLRKANKMIMMMIVMVNNAYSEQNTVNYLQSVSARLAEADASARSEQALRQRSRASWSRTSVVRPNRPPPTSLS